MVLGIALVQLIRPSVELFLLKPCNYCNTKKISDILAINFMLKSLIFAQSKCP